MQSSVRFVLSLGVGIFVVFSIGIVGGFGTFGSIESALEVSGKLQHQQTRRVSETITRFFEKVENDILALSELLENASSGLENRRVTSILKSFIRHKSYLNDLTVVRKDGTNVMVWQEGDGLTGAELNGDLDEESLEIAVEGKPGDGTEGFEDIYMEPEDKRPVVSYTKHLVDTLKRPIGTIYLDMDLATLSSEISATGADEGRQTFVFDQSGTAMAHPTLVGQDAYQKWDYLPRVDDLEDPVVSAIFARVRDGAKSFNQIEVMNKRWLVSIAEIKDIGDTSWYAVSVVPRDAVLGPAMARTKVIAIIGLVTLFLSVTLALIVGRSIVLPITRLASAAEAVRSLNIDLPTDSRSRFTELNLAESAFAAMLRGLETFSRYVPKNLVKQLIRLEASGGDVEPEEREVTILFTDIAGYTSISDGMRPKELAHMLNEYFEAVVLPVINCDGTVDKFIGDAVMAFWNAPVAQVDHADRALTAALEIQKVTGSINEERILRGERPLVTRIGVHTGTVLVGNIGASERINYTIVGDAVNTTARLEALGKEVGETFCVSSDTKAAAKGDYEWREVASVQLRGRSSDTQVFTLQLPPES